MSTASTTPNPSLPIPSLPLSTESSSALPSSPDSTAPAILFDQFLEGEKPAAAASQAPPSDQDSPAPALQPNQRQLLLLASQYTAFSPTPSPNPSNTTPSSPPENPTDTPQSPAQSIPTPLATPPSASIPVNSKFSSLNSIPAQPPSLAATTPLTQFPTELPFANSVHPEAATQPNPIPFSPLQAQTLPQPSVPSPTPFPADTPTLNSVPREIVPQALTTSPPIPQNQPSPLAIATESPRPATDTPTFISVPREVGQQPTVPSTNLNQLVPVEKQGTQLPGEPQTINLPPREISQQPMGAPSTLSQSHPSAQPAPSFIPQSNPEPQFAIPTPQEVSQLANPQYSQSLANPQPIDPSSLVLRQIYATGTNGVSTTPHPSAGNNQNPPIAFPDPSIPQATITDVAIQQPPSPQTQSQANGDSTTQHHTERNSATSLNPAPIKGQSHPTDSAPIPFTASKANEAPAQSHPSSTLAAARQTNPETPANPPTAQTAQSPIASRRESNPTVVPSTHASVADPSHAHQPSEQSPISERNLLTKSNSDSLALGHAQNHPQVFPFRAPLAPEAIERPDILRALNRVEEAIQALNQSQRGRMDLEVSLSENQNLRIRIELRNGEIHTVFRTDSPELRDALERAWPEFVARNNLDKGVRIADVTFQSQPNSLSADSSADYRNPNFQRPTSSSEEPAGTSQNFAAPSQTSKANQSAPAQRPTSPTPESNILWA